MIVYTNYKRMRSLKWHIIESLKRTINSSKRIWNHNSCLFVYCKKEHIHHRNQDYNCARQTHVLSNKDTPVTLELKRSKMPCKVKKSWLIYWGSNIPKGFIRELRQSIFWLKILNCEIIIRLYSVIKCFYFSTS